MPKSKGTKRKQQGNWSAADHAERSEHKEKKNRQDARRHERTALLTHDTFDKRQQLRVKLHFTKTSRKMEQLKERLMQWDPVAEAELQRKEEEEEKKQLLLLQDQEQGKKKKWVRPGPETWKLKGAARPAHLVYDFDTRYQCPHQKAHDDYRTKQSRLQNLLQTPMAKQERAASVLRDYLSTLMQCGHLQVEMGGNNNNPIPYWQECMTLERLHSVQWTTAPRDILQWYMDQGNYQQAEQFLDQHPPSDDVWWVFSTAWLAVELQRSPHARMVSAIRNNPFGAYYLAFYETFDQVFEYQEELQEADDIPQSSLEEAIEYCSSVGKMWKSNGADRILQRLILGTLLQEPKDDDSKSELTWRDLEWKKRLSKIEKVYEKQRNNDSDDNTAEGPDISMYAEMFRTSMDMLEQAGTIPKIPL
ncbi:hypothetical protein FisN_8Lh074 [Fistulifera solaris]|uniref:Uncharacterized protein n=1 Tax=Fistulifera solaris TaxID=1519565 RepID=A0A1Z5JDD1_FISSO|nr:hypothetical protein FisN_8Lh074 [Fistulifera solaris]|eukprot:GAX11979.1 hypothetical protein FisN_8Lh074 [Fistulifera solaris]